MNKKILFLFMTSVLLAACSLPDSVYDPSYLQEIAKANFPVKNVDPNQDWNMISSCSATVAVNEDAGEECTINFYNGDPYNKDTKAYLLGQISMKGGQSAQQEFDIPKALDVVYVTKISKSGYSSTIPTMVEDGKIAVTFGSASRSLVASRSGIVIRKAEGLWTPESKYKNITAVPSDAVDLGTIGDQWNNVVQGGNYIVTNGTTSINVGKNVNLFITGDNVVLSQFAILVGNVSNIIVMSGAKLKINNDLWAYSNHQCYIYNLGTIECSGCNLSDLKFYNAGNFNSTGNVDLNGTTQFINEGTLNCASASLLLSNGTTIFDNYNDVKAKDFHVAGSSQFYNEDQANVTVSGESRVDSNNCTWINGGMFSTKNMVFNANSSNWINSCKLIVTEMLNINLSSSGENGLTLDANSYVEAQNLCMDNSRINMAAGSYFYVKGEAKFKYNYYGYGSNLGFIAMGDEPALIRLNKATAENEGQRGTISYVGNIRVASDSHFLMKHDDGKEDNMQSSNIIIKDGAQLTRENECNIHFDEVACRPSYKAMAPTPVPTTPGVYTFAFEDMFKEVGDYDFNDVVVKAYAPVDGNVKIVLAAAGASKDLKVFCKVNNGKEIALFGGKEVHEAFGVASGVLINTGPISVPPVEDSVSVPSGFSIKDLDVYIKGADVSTEIHIPAHTPSFVKGDVPYSILVPVDWEFPVEKQCVIDKYPKFVNWALDATVSGDWYNK